MPGLAEQRQGCAARRGRRVRRSTRCQRSRLGGVGGPSVANLRSRHQPTTRPTDANAREWSGQWRRRCGRAKQVEGSSRSAGRSVIAVLPGGGRTSQRRHRADGQRDSTCRTRFPVADRTGSPPCRRTTRPRVGRGGCGNMDSRLGQSGLGSRPALQDRREATPDSTAKLARGPSGDPRDLGRIFAGGEPLFG